MIAQKRRGFDAVSPYLAAVFWGWIFALWWLK